MTNYKDQLMQFASRLIDIENTSQDGNTFIKELTQIFLREEKMNKISVEKIAKKYGIIDQRTIKEQTEYCLVQIYRGIAHNESLSVNERYDKIVSFYKKQVNLSFRNSTSIILQQYSTAAPIAFLMGIYCKINERNDSNIFLEPSAGNGLLTIAGNPSEFIVNEIDSIRYQNLLRDGYLRTLNKDATTDMGLKMNYYDAILTNPPFGSLLKNEYRSYGTYEMKNLDFLMVSEALLHLDTHGKAAIIVGGHTKYDELGRINKGVNRVFLSYLYAHYHVEDVINVNGDLYSKMGTSFNIRLILINGPKKKKEGYAPLKEFARAEQVNTFEELYHRVINQESLK